MVKKTRLHIIKGSFDHVTIDLLRAQAAMATYIFDKQKLFIRQWSKEKGSMFLAYAISIRKYVDNNCKKYL